MKKRAQFEWVVLAMAAAALLLMTVCFLADTSPRVSVTVEREDSPAASEPEGEEEWPDSLLEGEVMDLNTATAADLTRLPGIGPGRARAIADYRQEHGLFTRVEELMQVDGIGEAVFNRIRPYIKVG